MSKPKTKSAASKTPSAATVKPQEVMVVEVLHTFESCPAKHAETCQEAADMMRAYARGPDKPFGENVDITRLTEVISRGAHRFLFIIKTSLDVGTVENTFSDHFAKLLPDRSVEVIDIGEDAGLAATHLDEKAKKLLPKPKA